MRRLARQLAFNLIALLVVLLPMALAACGSGAPSVDWQLQVAGDVSEPTTFSYKELANMPQVDLTDIMMERSHGEDEYTSWSGVPLAEIFDRVGAPPDYVAITALAADGYAIEISRDELEGGIVALQQGGEWIATSDADHGPIRLVCPNTPANRWVFQLTEIQVVGP